ncbi:MAG: hybrid sensor histidine kinase/response regulator [Candidatus Riflebacteria bacterium]|nr:hybrid sensor histidine kinase/response regulator [Candidatus Riflebacteria bacterium]
MDGSQEGSTIWVVDDDASVRKLLTDYLGRLGFRVDTFEVGLDAIEAARARTPDLFLLDIGLPDVNGYAVCKRLKADPLTAPVPVIFLSGWDETVDRLNAFGCGGVDCLSKPIDLDELRVRVDTHLKLRLLQRQLEGQNRQLEDLVCQRSRELFDAHQRLSILDHAKSAFLELISHELRTPLTGLFGVAEILLGKTASDPGQQKLHRIYWNTQARLMQIIEDALLLTRIDVSKGPFNRSVLPLRRIVAAAIASASPLASSRTVAIGSPPELPQWVLGDERLLARAFTSLIETSVKFSLAGETVRFELGDRSDHAIVAIRSRGRTVPEHVFARFFDVLAIAEPITPGGDLGLGPALAQRIVKLFSGGVTVRNEGDSGIVLEVTLRTVEAPAACPPEPPG